MDMAGAARSVAWAQCWDNDEVLGRVKLQVHAAVGLELRKIPSELRRALQLKAKLLPAALKDLDHLHDIPAKKARQEGEGRGGGEVLCVTFSLSPSLSFFSTAALWRHAARSACGGRWIKKEATIFRTSRGGQPSGGGANYRGKCFAATAAARAAGAAAGAAAAAAAADAAADAAAADAAAADAAAAAAASDAATATAAAESWWRPQRTRSWRRWKGWHPAQAGTEPCSWKHEEVNVTVVAMAVAVASVVTVPNRSFLS
jgi:hypothetical protein